MQYLRLLKATVWRNIRVYLKPIKGLNIQVLALAIYVLLHFCQENWIYLDFPHFLQFWIDIIMQYNALFCSAMIIKKLLSDLFNCVIIWIEFFLNCSDITFFPVPQCWVKVEVSILIYVQFSGWCVQCVVWSLKFELFSWTCSVSSVQWTSCSVQCSQMSAPCRDMSWPWG